jgi:TfoX/Sxy family transcriptional regulator of competence genes
LQYVGADGKPANKPLWQFEKELRSDSRWQYTDNARDSIDSLTLKVARDMGLV